MAAPKQSGSSTGPVLAISGSILMPIIFSIILFVALAGKANGSSAMQPIDVGNQDQVSQVQTALASLESKSDSEGYIVANSASVSIDLTTKLNILQEALKTDQVLASTPKAKQALNLIVKIKAELNAISINAITNKALAAQNAKAFMADRNTLTGIFSTTSSEQNGNNNVPLYKQNNYASTAYGVGYSLKSSGCGIMAASMVLNFYHKNVDPVLIGQYSLDNGFRAPAGTAHGLYSSLAKKYGLHAVEITNDWDKILSELKQGKPVIVSGHGARPFTGKSHFVVLTGINSDGSINVNDSAGGKDRDGKSYSQELIRSEMHFATTLEP